MRGSKLLRAAILAAMAASLAAAEFQLDCSRRERNRNGSGSHLRRRKHYLPNLITLSRLDGGRYAIDLRCQGATPDGEPVPEDYRHERAASKMSPWLLERRDGAALAKYVSMSCGGLCFREVIGEEDLLAGRICRNRDRRRCLATSIQVMESPKPAGESDAAVKLWAPGLILVAVVVSIVAYFFYK